MRTRTNSLMLRRSITGRAMCKFGVRADCDTIRAAQTFQTARVVCTAIDRPARHCHIFPWLILNIEPGGGNGGGESKSWGVSGGVDQEPRDGGAEGHLRLFSRDGLRVVRLLSLRGARAILRGAVLPARQPDGGAVVGLRGVRRGFSRAAVRGARLRAHR